MYEFGTNEYVNSWLLDSMRRYYFWSDDLPTKPDLGAEPKRFFQAIKNGQDRFSYIYLPNDPASFDVSSRSAFGFDYAVLENATDGSFFGIVKLVLKDSPAERAGLKRGDVITAINGKSIHADNSASLYEELLNSQTFMLTIRITVGGELVEQSVEIHKGLSFEQPVIHQIFLQGSKKVGYIYIDHFSFGLTASLISVFEHFKTEGVEELILDLRYNLGGEVSEAAGLCALVAPNIEFDTPFIIYKGNKNGGTRKESFGVASTFDGYIRFEDVQNAALRLSKIYLLTTGATASSAEVVINCLKPYMEVVTIGEKTLGKDLASFLIKDFSSPQKISWQIQPIVYKLYNAGDVGDYGSGFLPTVEIDELSSLPLPAMGDSEDVLIKTALNQIQGERGKAYRTGAINRAVLHFDSQLNRPSGNVVLTHK